VVCLGVGEKDMWAFKGMMNKNHVHLFLLGIDTQLTHKLVATILLPLALYT
jgi:hypothetical protein